MRGITKALLPKTVKSRRETECKLPEQIKSYVDLFLDDSVSNQNTLIPRRPSVDTGIDL